MCYSWFGTLRKNKDEMTALKQICLSIGNCQTVARIGFVLESLGVDASELLPKIGDTGTLLPLVPMPKNARRGKTNTRWRIIENVSLAKIFATQEVPDEDE